MLTTFRRQFVYNGWLTINKPQLLRWANLRAEPSRCWLHKSSTSLAKASFHEVPVITKDAVLYQNNNQRFFRIVSFFGISQFLFWSGLGMWAGSELRDVDTETERPQEENTRPIVIKTWEFLNIKDKYRWGIAFLFYVFGAGFLLTTGMYTLRSVRGVVLRKGGKVVDLVTFDPFGGRRTLSNILLDHISCQQSMHLDKPYLSLKIKDRAFYFLVDKKGQFPRPELFEKTIGIHRTFTKK